MPSPQTPPDLIKWGWALKPWELWPHCLVTSIALGLGSDWHKHLVPKILDCEGGM